MFDGIKWSQNAQVATCHIDLVTKSDLVHGGTGGAKTSDCIMFYSRVTKEVEEIFFLLSDKQEVVLNVSVKIPSAMLIAVFYILDTVYSVMFIFYLLLDVNSQFDGGYATTCTTYTRRARYSSNYNSNVQLFIYWTTMLYIMSEIYKMATEKMGSSTDTDVDTGFPSDPDSIHLGCDNHYLWITA